MEVICLTGFMGSGKTSSGRILARALDMAFADLDDVISAREGLTIPEIFAQRGEAGFREAEFSALKELLEDGGSMVIALGGGCFTYGPSRELAMQKSTVVYLRTRLETVRARIGDSDPSRPLFRNAAELYEKRGPVYELAHYSLDTDGLTPQQTADAIVAVLRQS